MRKDIVIMLLLFLTGLQAGFLFKCYWDYKYGPVPMLTPSELIGVMEER